MSDGRCGIYPISHDGSQAHYVIVEFATMTCAVKYKSPSAQVEICKKFVKSSDMGNVRVNFEDLTIGIAPRAATQDEILCDHVAYDTLPVADSLVR